MHDWHVSATNHCYRQSLTRCIQYSLSKRTTQCQQKTENLERQWSNSCLNTLIMHIADNAIHQGNANTFPHQLQAYCPVLQTVLHTQSERELVALPLLLHCVTFSLTWACKTQLRDCACANWWSLIVYIAARLSRGRLGCKGAHIRRSIATYNGTLFSVTLSRGISFTDGSVIHPWLLRIPDISFWQCHCQNGTVMHISACRRLHSSYAFTSFFAGLA